MRRHTRRVRNRKKHRKHVLSKTSAFLSNFFWYLADTLIRSKVALKLYNKYRELISRKGRMQFRLHDLRELLQVGIQLNWQIP